MIGLVLLSSTMSTDQYAYAANEKVLCYHGPLIYEAKIVNLRMEEGSPQYLVHYKGWKQTWDEWVPEDRVLKYNEANINHQKQLHNKSSSSAQNASKAQAKGARRVYHLVDCVG